MNKTYLISLTLTSLLTGCLFFDEAEPIYLGRTAAEQDDPDPEELTRPFGATVATALSAVTPSDLTSPCSVGTGDAHDLVGLQPGGRLGVGQTEIDNPGTKDSAFLQDEFPLPVAQYAREHPFAAGCVEASLVDPAVEAASSDAASVARLIRHAAEVSGQGAWQGQAADRGDFDSALQAICAVAVAHEIEAAEEAGTVDALDWSETPCESNGAELPEALKTALTPVLWAIHDGVEAREDAQPEYNARDADFWRDFGGVGLMAFQDAQAGFNAEFEEDRTYLGRDRSKLYGAAAEIAAAVQAVDWSSFDSLTGIEYDFSTPVGMVRVRGSEPHSYGATEPETLLLVELGGDDRYLDETASNRSGANPVAVVVDVDGSDFYGYDEAATFNLEQPGVLPRDADGAVSANQALDQATASEKARQGAARNGIAMLFDLGGDNDQYIALRASQGYAHQGVGVLFDDGGSDIYRSEMSSQGAAQYGIALAIDLGNEDDTRIALNSSQGFGFVQGVGLLFDQAGNDNYECLGRSNDIIYFSPQLPDESNSSLCQGVGQGFRFIEPGFESFSLAGGVGLLIDVTGDDEYEAGVYGQGAGFWQGFGLLSDRSGSDMYDTLYYGQGVGVHFGVGYLTDGGDGDDSFQTKDTPSTFVMGVANDFSVGVFVNERGNDRYTLPDQGAGIGVCGSVGLFVDNGGDDTYNLLSGSAFGHARSYCRSPSDEILSRNFASTGVFVDVGGTDSYPAGFSNDDTWGTEVDDLEANASADGAGLDAATGDSGIHVGQ